MPNKGVLPGFTLQFKGEHHCALHLASVPINVFRVSILVPCRGFQSELNERLLGRLHYTLSCKEGV